jgi:small subunit ribosomal protein S6
MRNYEVTFVVDPTLSGDEVKKTAQKYADQLANEGFTIGHTEEIGLRQLAYQINKRHSGFYYCVEFSGEQGTSFDKVELAMRRDDNILRFLTVALDKYGVQYNQDKRDGKVGKRKAMAVAAAKAKKEGEEAAAAAEVVA